MNRRTKAVIVSSLAVVILAIGFVRPALSTYIYIARAREILDYLERDDAQLSCIYQIQGNPEERARVMEALSAIEQALRIDPSNTTAQRLAGQIYCLSGDYPSAIWTFNDYLSKREKDPLVHLEAGLAHLNICCNSDQQVEPNCESATEHLQKAGLSTEDLLANSLSAYRNAQYQVSKKFLAWNTCLAGQSSPATDLMFAIASIQSGDIETSLIPSLNYIAIKIEKDAAIQEDQLYWLRQGDKFGQPLDQVTIMDSTAGVMWSSGQAGTIIYISDPGQYTITMRVLDKPPSPIQLQIEHNSSSMQQFELTKGDNTWSEITSQLDLEPGYHIIGVEFLNDGIVNDIDRNLYIDWIIIQNE